MTRWAPLLVAAVVSAVTTTMSPTQHNFGRFAVRAGSPPFSFRVTLPTGALLTDSIDVSIVGADPLDFVLADGRTRGVPLRLQCGLGQLYPTPGACDVGVQFDPGSVGPKSARLQVVDKAGTVVTAALSGHAVAPVCTMAVVSCNYAHLYSGSFSWQSDLDGPYGQHRKSVTVNVLNGVATCSGSMTDVIIDNQGNRATRVGTILGDGLIGIEFEKDSAGRDVYRISGACPSAHFPATPTTPAIPAEPAELGSSTYEESYQQPIPRSSPFPPAALRGGRNVAHPDVDPANGVTGSMSVTWAFTRS